MKVRKKTVLFLVAALVLVILLTSCTTKTGGWTITIRNHSGSDLQVYIAPSYPGTWLPMTYVYRMDIVNGTTVLIEDIANGSSLCLAQKPPKTWDAPNFVVWPGTVVDYLVTGNASFDIQVIGNVGTAVPMQFFEILLIKIIQ